MEIFKTSVTIPGEGVMVSWQASPTEAAMARKRSVVEGFPGVTTQTINIPTSKGPLVAWLNANVRG